MGLFERITTSIASTGSATVPGNVPAIPDPDRTFTMPAEEDPHEGTWLQWPHNYGSNRRRNLVARYESSWVAMTIALHREERVHIIVYNAEERNRVFKVLMDASKEGSHLLLEKIDFYEWPTEDVWVRDNGPIFVFDEVGRCLGTR